MTPKCWGMSVAAAACAMTFGCAAGNADDGELSNSLTGPCVPGQAVACVCPDGTTSARTCTADGASYNLCACYPGAGAGTGIAGGAGIGQPGTAGMGPLAGTTAPPTSSAGTGAGTGASGVSGSGSMLPRAGTSAPTAGAGGMSMVAGTGGGGAVEPPDPGMTDPNGLVPAGDYCAPAASWDPAWVAFEDEVLRLVNVNRAMGWNCDTEGQFGAAPPLTTQPNLRCSARLHSQDMDTRDFFAHDNPDGDGPSERMDAAGYMGGTWGENIAMGQRTPQQVVDGWMESDGHCANIMREQFTQIGVGFFQGADRNAFYWTQNFGAPCTGRFCM